MRQFKDRNGKTWSVEVDVPARAVVQRETQFDLFAALDPDEIRKLGDPAMLVDVLYVLCKEQADKIALTPEQFGRSFSGDVLDEASDALIGAIEDFFPSRRGKVLAAMQSKAHEIGEKASAAALKAIAELDVDKLLSDGMASTSNSKSTSSPASPESTQTEEAAPSAD